MELNHEFSWSDGYHPKGDAQVVGEEVYKLAQSKGVDLEHIPPDELVSAAASDDSPIHDLFEWDDSVAAHEYRLNQARNVLRSLRVIIKKPEGVEKRRFMVNIVKRSEDEPVQKVYATVETALKRPEYRNQVLIRALRELISWRERFKEFQELAQFFSEPQYEQFIARTKTVLDAIEKPGNIAS